MKPYCKVLPFLQMLVTLYFVGPL